MQFNQILILIAFTTLLCGCTTDSSHKVNDSGREAINTLLLEQQAAWNNGNLDGFMESYKNAPDMSFVTSEGILLGHETLANRYEKSYPGPEAMGKLKFEIVDFIPAGKNHAMVIGKWALKRDFNSTGGFFSLLWQKTPEGWKIIHDHTS